MVTNHHRWTLVSQPPPIHTLPQGQVYGQVFVREGSLEKAKRLMQKDRCHSTPFRRECRVQTRPDAVTDGRSFGELTSSGLASEHQ